MTPYQTDKDTTTKLVDISNSAIKNGIFVKGGYTMFSEYVVKDLNFYFCKSLKLEQQRDELLSRVQKIIDLYDSEDCTSHKELSWEMCVLAKEAIKSVEEGK